MNKTIRITLLLIVTIAGMVGVGYLFHTGPQAQEETWDDRNLRQPVPPITVSYEDFGDATKAAIKLWNNVQSDLFVMSVPSESMVRVLSDNGTPCGDPWRPHDEECHSGLAYQCPDGTWEIHVTKPGDSHMQYCIISHELGHVLGLADDPPGKRVMNQGCAEHVLVSDKDAAAVKERYKDDGGAQ